MGKAIHWAKEYKVNPRDLQLIMRRAVLIVDSVFASHGKTVTITCTGGGDHSPGSLHPWGYAFDARTRNLTSTLKTKIYNEIKDKLKGTGYQIIWHSTHYHIEYDPPDWKDTF